MRIEKVSEDTVEEWLPLALALWPDDSTDEMRETLDSIIQSPGQTGFLARNEGGLAVGFINLSLRSDYVPGADQTPVAYVEGIYVAPDQQQQGVGRALIERAEQWATTQGCSELASDVMLGNSLGENFHNQVGFEEVERVIFFIKKIQ